MKGSLQLGFHLQSMSYTFQGSRVVSTYRRVELAKAVDCVIHVTLRVSKIDYKYRATRLSGCIGQPSRSQDNSLAVFFNSYSFLWGYNIGIASM